VSLNKLLSQASSQTLKWLEDPQGSQFNELIRDWIDAEERKLHSSPDDVEIFRAQGALKYLGMITRLHQDIQSYLHDVATGKRKKIDPKEIEHGVAGLGKSS